MATRERKTKWSKIIVFLGASQHVRIEFSSKSSSALYFVHIGSKILATRTLRRNFDSRAVCVFKGDKQLYYVGESVLIPPYRPGHA